MAEGLVVLALLVVDGVLTGAVALAFTPLYLGAVPAPLGALLTTTWQSLLLVVGGVLAGLWALRRVRDQPPDGTR